ncbi:MAG TPA: NAD(P)/FAD-dependent oxidoreductase [Campylobacterales bacterium]|nr:NAD(P)/FAD-dependent oxidoreductase [Campylobacterales bacterium]
MSMERRDLFKLAGVAAAAAVIPSVAVTSASAAEAAKKASGKSVVIVGGGFGGLTMAKELKKKDKTIDVTVIEKRDIFMSCPFSNTYLGGLEDVSLADLTHDYYAPATKHGYNFVQAEVTAIDKGAKTVTTTNGNFSYDILVLSPGIAYDYKGQFPAWSDEKIAHVAQACPAALITGSEHLALKRQLVDMDDGDVVIVPPATGKYRCPPAPYERTAMVANYMKAEEIKGKVIVLDTRGGKFAKGAAFKESWADLYDGMIDYKGFTQVVDVDPAKNEITYLEYPDAATLEEGDPDEAKKHTIKYQVCNLIPNNMCSPVIKMAGIETNGGGYALMDGYSFRSKTDKNIYVIGDAVSHGIPPSGQTAIWGAKRAAGQIVDQLAGKTFDAKAGLPAAAANVCYSMVSGSPDEAIMVTHEFSADPSGVLKGKGNVPKPKDGNGKFRSKGTGKATREWFAGVKRELFM